MVVVAKGLLQSGLQTVVVTQLSHSGHHSMVITQLFCQAVGQADVKLS
jgi:hypothetical protein